jgi:molecular chaperone DnaK
MVYSTEKTLKDFEGKVPESEVKEIQERLGELKKLLEPKEKNATEIKKKMDELTQLVQKSATELYQKAAQQKQQSSPPEGEEKIVDAEVKEKKKKT